MLFFELSYCRRRTWYRESLIAQSWWLNLKILKYCFWFWLSILESWTFASNPACISNDSLFISGGFAICQSWFFFSVKCFYHLTFNKKVSSELFFKIVCSDLFVFKLLNLLSYIKNFTSFIMDGKLFGIIDKDLVC